MTFDAFVGQSYTSRSIAADAQRSMNLYLETDESGDGRAPRALMNTPGLSVLVSLPNSPIRGIWSGLTDSLPGAALPDQLNVVAGSKLYSISSAGTYTLIGDVGTDAANTPVSFQVNGAQLLISSAGKVWCYDATGLSQVYYNDGYGTVTTSGTAVTWVSGSPFDSSQVGGGISINGTVYLIAGFTDATHITLASSAGTQTNVKFFVVAGASTVTTSSSLGSTVVVWQSGDQFSGVTAGQQVVLNGAIYTVSSVQNSRQFTLSSSPGVLFSASLSFASPVLGGMTAFLDSYFIALPPDSGAVYISGIQDGRTWNPLDFARKEGFPDNINAILGDHEQLWLFGTETTEIWTDTGAANFPFQRSQFINTGCRAPFSVAAIAQGVAWIGGDTRGNPIAWYAEGYIPQRISTHAIEAAWAQYSTITDAIAFVYYLDGHQFWQVTFPTANATWVYDRTEKAWHERGTWNGSSWDRHAAAFHAYAFGKHIVGGSYAPFGAGNVYVMDPSLYSDAGIAIKRRRTAPYISNEENFTFFERFRLSMQTGITPTLAWSDDQGATYNTPRAAASRMIGGSTSNSVWRRLGKARVRVFQVDISDAAQVCLNAAYIDATPGNS
jgi:hypothetical protein